MKGYWRHAEAWVPLLNTRCILAGAIGQVGDIGMLWGGFINREAACKDGEGG